MSRKPLVLNGGLIEQLQDGDLLDGAIPAIGKTTLYLSPTGDDLTGDGSYGNPWFSINKVISHLKPYRLVPGATITVNVAAGEYAYTETQLIDHQDGARIKFQGEVYAVTFSNIVSVTGSAGDWSITIQVTPALSGLEETGQYVTFYWLTSTWAYLDLSNVDADLEFRPPDAASYSIPFTASSAGSEAVTYDAETGFTLSYDAGVTTANSMKATFDAAIAAHPEWPQWTCSVEGTGSGTWDAADDGTTVTSGPDPRRLLLAGVHEITNVDTGNNRLTLNVKQKSSYEPHMLTSGNGTGLRTRLTCSTDVCIRVTPDCTWAPHNLLVSGLGSQMGVELKPRAILYPTEILGIANCWVGLWTQADSLVVSDQMAISDCDTLIWSKGGRFYVAQFSATAGNEGLTLDGSVGQLASGYVVGCQHWGLRAIRTTLDASGDYIANLGDGVQAIMGSAIDMPVSTIAYNGGIGIKASTAAVVNMEASSFWQNLHDCDPAVGTYNTTLGLIVNGVF